MAERDKKPRSEIVVCFKVNVTGCTSQCNSINQIAVVVNQIDYIKNTCIPMDLFSVCIKRKNDLCELKEITTKINTIISSLLTKKKSKKNDVKGNKKEKKELFKEISANIRKIRFEKKDSVYKKMFWNPIKDVFDAIQTEAIDETLAYQKLKLFLDSIAISKLNLVYLTDDLHSFYGKLCVEMSRTTGYFIDMEVESGKKFKASVHPVLIKMALDQIEQMRVARFSDSHVLKVMKSGNALFDAMELTLRYFVTKRMAYKEFIPISMVPAIESKKLSDVIDTSKNNSHKKNC